jgi:hypothetical protein
MGVWSVIEDTTILEERTLEAVGASLSSSSI